MDSEDSDLECKPLGESLFIDPKSKKSFYHGVIVQNVPIRLGDCVKVTLATGDEENDSASVQSTTSGEAYMFGYCQVLAVFMDPDEGMMIEARWFYETNDEVFNPLRGSSKSKKQRVQIDLKDDEIVEGELIDDIPAGSIVENIHVKFPSNTTSDNSTTLSSTSSFNSNNNSTELILNCRYFKSIESNSLQLVTGDNFFQRGMEYSEYKSYYSTYLKELASSSLFDSDNNDTTAAVAVMQVCDPSVKKYMDALQKLHVSYVPESLPCRENEKSVIQDFIRSYIQGTAASKPIYIAGIPGTGKTATVSACVASLKKECTQGSMHLPEFQYIEINCLRLQSPTDAYTVFWRSLTGEQLSSKTAFAKLTNYYATKAATATTAKSSLFTVLLLDEIDFLCVGDGLAFYSFFNWPLMNNSRLAVVGVSNVIDLPERLRNRVQSRINNMMTRISFKAYNHEQIREILLNRLSELGAVNTIFDAKAIEFLARKASAVAGDLRAALKICQRSIQIYVERKRIATTTTADSTTSSATTTTVAIVKPDIITHDIVKVAVDEYSQDPFKLVVRNCCQLDKSIIVSACRHMKSTGDVLLSLDMLLERLQDLLAAIESDAVNYSSSNSGNSSSSRSSSSDSSSSSDANVYSLSTTNVSNTNNNNSNNNNNNNEVFEEEITLLLPPYEIFETAIQRLVRRGIFARNSIRLQFVPRLAPVSLTVDVGTITGALRETPFFKFL